jgi:hypothetical protein
VPLRHRQHILDAQAAFGGTSCYGSGEALHDRARRVYYERHGIHIGLISDGVRSASGQRNYVTCNGSHRPRRSVRIADIEGELAFEDVIDLAGTMSVNYWRTSPGGIRTSTANRSPFV